ncbi:DUF2837 family protein, partial [Paraburkholderia sp. BR14319]|uniref:lipid II flippase family protein n=1 Tax=Paraburkholderia sp. BR14319 TaxID=3237005 RepID=UPI0034D1E349
AYAVRIAGVRTRRIAVSFSLFGIIALVSRTANSFQGPFIAKRRAPNGWRIKQSNFEHLASLCRNLIFGSSSEQLIA